MLALDEQFDQALGNQQVQVDAGGGRTHVRDDGEFRARARVAVQQGIEDARARRRADGGGNSGDGQVGMSVHIHTSMIDEA